MKRFLTLFAVAAMTVIGGVQSDAVRANAATSSASIVFVNDAHDIRPVTAGGLDRGGVARLGTVVEGVRQEQPNTQFVLGGDLGGGTLFGGLYKGHPMVDAFNRMNLDLAGFGQHEFDFGVDNVRSLIAESNFPWISSNLQDTNGQPFVQNGTWKVLESGGISVGYIALTDSMSTSSVAGEVIEQDLVSSAAAAVKEMIATERPDVIIALAQTPLDSAKVISAAVPEIDGFLLEEMSETEPLIEEVNDVVFGAAEGNMGSVIRLDITKLDNGAVELNASAIEVDHTVTPDPALKLLEEQYEADIQARLSEELATVAEPLIRTDQHVQRTRESLIGNAASDAFRHYHQADIGWVNGGGIRADVSGSTLTLNDAYSVFPFNNKVMLVDVTGADIVAALEAGVAKVEKLGGGFPQVSGMSYGYDPTAPIGTRVHSVQVAGETILSDKIYSIALTNYVFKGGDGVVSFANGQVRVPAEQAPADAEVLAAWARSTQHIAPALEGRIVVGPAPTEAPAPETTAPVSTETPRAMTGTSVDTEMVATGTGGATSGDTLSDTSLASTGAPLQPLLGLLGASVLLLGAFLVRSRQATPRE